MTRENFQGYADDLVISVPGTLSLKVIHERIEKLISDHELMINVEKTKIVVFKPMGRALNADEYEYLDINIQSNLIKTSDILQVSKKRWNVSALFRFL